MIITIELEFQTGFQTGIRLGIRLVSDWYQTGHRPLLKLTTSKAQSPAAGLSTRTGRRGQDRTGRDGTGRDGRDGTGWDGPGRQITAFGSTDHEADPPCPPARRKWFPMTKRIASAAISTTTNINFHLHLTGTVRCRFLVDVCWGAEL